MKLATLNTGSRDGKLVVVSTDLNRYLPAPNDCCTLQRALEEWEHQSGVLSELAAKLDAGEGARFNQSACLAPLPRAYQWIDGSAYVNHVELVRQARGAEMPASFWTDPLVYQGGSDTFLAPHGAIQFPSAAADWGIDFEAEIAVIVGDVPMGASLDAARAAIKLVMLVNDISLRRLIPAELAKGFGFFQSKPSSAFSPVAVTPSALGQAWDGGKLHLPLLVRHNGALFGQANAGIDMTFDFPQLIAHCAKSRALSAGSIIGSGTVSNKRGGGPGQPVPAGGDGYSCLAEIRMIETIATGHPETPFMADGDTVQIEMLDDAGQSLFGCIDQTVRLTD